MRNKNQLEYASFTKPKPASAPITGIVALIAGAIQLPWLFFVILMAWGDRWQLNSGAGPTDQDSIYAVIAFAQGVIGIACGIYSIWRAGFGKHNICGSVGMSLFGCVVLYFLIQIAVTWLRANGYFGYVG